jgi:hypothetical protein
VVHREMLDLMEHIDENYRTKAPAEFEETR